LSANADEINFRTKTRHVFIETVKAKSCASDVMTTTGTDSTVASWYHTEFTVLASSASTTG
jgi:hypothetical protein